MSLSMYQASIPTFRRTLTSLAAILAKGAAHAEAKQIDPSVFLNARLAPDMFPLVRQVQIASDAAKGGAARLAGVDVPSYPDVETSFAELQERIAKTLAFIDGLDAAQFEGAETRSVTLKLRDREVTFNGQDFLFGFAVPNLYFHLTTTYNILRHNGVELGKRDFLGA
ncbi:DUF1993 family protein [Pseudomonas sp. UL073]|uniref:DUF1993 family protein n=1 Tax=Zestomonas insulae TaxID=2809017 RepID=A0ABS2IBS4_9GAMM|nr:DUF1993 family protein [Pseudomonas insulae]MBM7060559.1 DUF1993 family protein [Pseudomonas insulae]